MYAADDYDSSCSSNSEDSNLPNCCPETRWGTSAAHSSRYEGDPPPHVRPLPPPTIARSIIHLDVDSFYCQCEELADPTGNLAARPLAIGQKHIVVTCNYVARSRGIKKLMLRTDAKRVCPDLTIVEGSDLEPYRRQARKIYNSFRRAVASLPGGSAVAKKGGMDECYADVSAAVDASSSRLEDPSVPEGVFVYGESSSMISIAEDQSGATAHIVSSRQGSGASMGNDDHDDDDRWGDRGERRECARRLRIAAGFAEVICRAVQDETGFTACAGTSSSAMLAKIASELRKPNSVNLLYPWRAPRIIDTMPLRKIPGLGSRTLQCLESCLEEYNANSSSDGDWWACRDLLKVPRSAIISSLATRKAFESSCDEQCDLLLQRCRGIDPVPIVDDNGGLARTVSVEDSYRRGTVTSREGVLHALEALYVRLPRLLDDRISDSDRPELSYPMALRLTARIVDIGCHNKKRPYVSASKQRRFDGKTLIRTDGAEQRSTILRDAILPMAESLLLQHAQPIDVTKLNIAASNFSDISSDLEGSASEASSNTKMTQFFTSVSTNGQKVGLLPKNVYGGKKKASPCGDVSHPSLSNKRASPSHRSTLPGMLSQAAKASVKERKRESAFQMLSKVDGIDLDVLAELPDEITSEIARDYGVQVKATKANKRGKIDSFFFPKARR